MKVLFLCAFLPLQLLCRVGLSSESRNSGASPLSIPERIAVEFAEASPLADPGDAQARDKASARLANCSTFRAHVGDLILWGGCDPVKGFDPKTYSLTEFDPMVWLKLYASTIMFTGHREVRKDGPLTILEMEARFRSNLDPGDYPYPFWHSPKKWQAYLDLSALVLVFRENKIVAAYRIAQADKAHPAVARPWDGKWEWIDANGDKQPRVALFSYIFSADNPHAASVDRSYRELEVKFRAQNCVTCHAPDNQGKAKGLVLLNFPNQSLAARHSLVEVLVKNEMPPEDTRNHRAAGIDDDAVRGELIRLAKDFVKVADAAVAFESRR